LDDGDSTNQSPTLCVPPPPKSQIHDGGARLREWSFRPSKATAFSSPALAASQQGLLLGVQGQHQLLAWPDKASLTAAGAAGPEGMQAVEVGFPVARLVAAQGPAGVAWCLGEEGQLACFSTQASSRGLLAVLGAAPASEGEPQQSRILASLASRRRPLLVVARADGSVQAFVAGTQPAEKGEAGATIPPLCQSGAKAVEPPSPGAQLLASGLMWAAGGREDSAYHWTLWSTPGASGVHVRVARLSLDSAPAATAPHASPPVLTLSVLYGKEVGASAASEAAAAAGRKRRRSTAAATGGAGAPAVVEAVVGLEGVGALVVVDRAGGVLQAWDAEHGVMLGEAAAATTEAAGTWVAGEGGVLAAVAGEGGEVSVWRVEAREGDGAGEGGLRRVLGKGLASVVSGSGSSLASASASVSASSSALGAVLVLSGSGEWVEASEAASGEEGGRSRKKGSKAQQQRGGEDDVEALLRLVAGDGGGKEQQQQPPQPQEQEQEQEQQQQQQQVKWGKARGPLARTPVSARTALVVARRCLGGDGEGPSEAAARGNKRRKGSGNEGPHEPLWRLLGALLDAGKLPLRERPFLMEELLEARGRQGLDLVKRVLGGPADVPERAVVRALQRALLLQGQGGQGEGGGAGDRVAWSLELVGLAVRRPCCPAFLRAALASELDGPTAALLLVLLKVLLERAVKGGAKARPGEEACLTWLEALLDANFVALVLESTSSSSMSPAGQGSAVRAALEGVRALAGEAAAACQALETVGGYVAQFRRAGHAMEVIPDYSLDTLAI
jgi:hypothetical protein